MDYRERENHTCTCILYMTHFAHDIHMLQDNDHSPAGVGCCEVVSDDVFSLSVPVASDTV